MFLIFLFCFSICACSGNETHHQDYERVITWRDVYITSKFYFRQFNDSFMKKFQRFAVDPFLFEVQQRRFWISRLPHYENVEESVSEFIRSNYQAAAGQVGEKAMELKTNLLKNSQLLRSYWKVIAMSFSCFLVFNVALFIALRGKKEAIGSRMFFLHRRFNKKNGDKKNKKNSVSVIDIVGKYGLENIKEHLTYGNEKVKTIRVFRHPNVKFNDKFSSVMKQLPFWCVQVVCASVIYILRYFTHRYFVVCETQNATYTIFLTARGLHIEEVPKTESLGLIKNRHDLKTATEIFSTDFSSTKRNLLQFSDVLVASWEYILRNPFFNPVWASGERFVYSLTTTLSRFGGSHQCPWSSKSRHDYARNNNSHLMNKTGHFLHMKEDEGKGRLFIFAMSKFFVHVIPIAVIVLLTEVLNFIFASSIFWDYSSRLITFYAATILFEYLRHFSMLVLMPKWGVIIYDCIVVICRCVALCIAFVGIVLVLGGDFLYQWKNLWVLLLPIAFERVLLTTVVFGYMKNYIASHFIDTLLYLIVFKCPVLIPILFVVRRICQWETELKVMDCDCRKAFERNGDSKTKSSTPKLDLRAVLAQNYNTARESGKVLLFIRNVVQRVGREVRNILLLCIEMLVMFFVVGIPFLMQLETFYVNAMYYSSYENIVGYLMKEKSVFMNILLWCVSIGVYFYVRKKYSSELRAKRKLSEASEKDLMEAKLAVEEEEGRSVEIVNEEELLRQLDEKSLDEDLLITDRSLDPSFNDSSDANKDDDSVEVDDSVHDNKMNMQLLRSPGIKKRLFSPIPRILETEIGEKLNRSLKASLLNDLDTLSKKSGNRKLNDSLLLVDDNDDDELQKSTGGDYKDEVISIAENKGAVKELNISFSLFNDDDVVAVAGVGDENGNGNEDSFLHLDVVDDLRDIKLKEKEQEVEELVMKNDDAFKQLSEAQIERDVLEDKLREARIERDVLEDKLREAQISHDELEDFIESLLKYFGLSKEEVVDLMAKGEKVEVLLGNRNSFEDLLGAESPVMEDEEDENNDTQEVEELEADESTFIEEEQEGEKKPKAENVASAVPRYLITRNFDLNKSCPIVSIPKRRRSNSDSSPKKRLTTTFEFPDSPLSEEEGSFIEDGDASSLLSENVVPPSPVQMERPVAKVVHLNVLNEQMLVKAKCTYSGGKEGPSILKWYRVKGQDEEVEEIVENENLYELVLSEDYVGWKIRLKYTPVRIDGMIGESVVATSLMIKPPPRQTPSPPAITISVDDDNVSVDPSDVSPRNKGDFDESKLSPKKGKGKKRKYSIKSLKLPNLFKKEGEGEKEAPGSDSAGKDEIPNDDGEVDEKKQQLQSEVDLEKEKKGKDTGVLMDEEKGKSSEESEEVDGEIIAPKKNMEKVQVKEKNFSVIFNGQTKIVTVTDKYLKFGKTQNAKIVNFSEVTEFERSKRGAGSENNRFTLVTTDANANVEKYYLTVPKDPKLFSKTILKRLQKLDEDEENESEEEEKVKKEFEVKKISGSIDGHTASFVFHKDHIVINNFMKILYHDIVKADRIEDYFKNVYEIEMEGGKKQMWEVDKEFVEEFEELIMNLVFDDEEEE